MCTGNCSARDPKNGPCPNGCTDPKECLGDHACERLGKQALRQTLIQTIPSGRQQKTMTDEEKTEFKAAAKAAGLPCGND